MSTSNKVIMIFQALYGIGCPLAVKTLGKTLMSNDSSIEDRMIAFGVALGKKACHVRKTKCKRSVCIS